MKKSKFEKRRQLGRRIRREWLHFESLEQRRLLAVAASATPSGDTLNLNFDVTYVPGQTVLALDDVYLRTNNNGAIEWSNQSASGFTSQNIPDLSAFNTINIGVKYGAQSNADFTQLWQNLFGSSISTLFVGNLNLPGKNVSISALDVEVQSGSTISTRQIAANGNLLTDASIGNSGSITIDAPQIALKSGANLLSDVGGAPFQAGNISLTANGSLDDISSGLISLPIPVPDISTAQSKIELTSSTIKGSDIVIGAEADAADLFSDQDAPRGWGSGEGLQEYFGSVSVVAGVAISVATSEVIVDGGSIDGGDVRLSSRSLTDAQARVLTLYGAAAYGQSEPKAKVTVRNAAQINAANNVSFTTFAQSEMNIQATQNLVGTSTTVEKFNITLAGGYSNVQSKINLASGTSIVAGNNMTVDADATRSHTVLSNAAAYGDGALATAINVAVHETAVEALMDGNIDIGGNLNATGHILTTLSEFTATSTVGTGPLSAQFFGSRLGKVASAGILAGSTAIFQRLFKFGNALDPQGTRVTELDVSAAINVGISFNEVDVRIGPGASVDVGGDIRLLGHAEEEPEFSAIAFLNSSKPDNPYSSKGSVSQREKGISAALSGGYIENDVDVSIGAGATVIAGDDIDIVGEASVPYDIPSGKAGWLRRFFDPQNVGVSTFSDKFNFNLGVQNAFFTSWTEAIASAQEKAYGGMLSIVLTNTHNYATIGNNAMITAGGDVRVRTDTDNDTINLVGSPIAPFNATPGTGVGGAVMLTGYINDNNASIAGGAVINADTLLVFANNRGQNVSIGLQGSASDGFGFNGAFTGRFVDNRTVAKVSDDAQLTLASGSVTVPLAFDEISQDATTLTTSVPQFTPQETYDEANPTLRRVNPTLNTITLPYDHRLATGDPLYYVNDASGVGGGINIGGLQSGTTYYAIVVNEATIQLATTKNNALLSRAIPINLTGT
ncbi:MAG: hypothetical protein AAF664_18735, partial [Planctomycetota bacterium]